MRPVTNSGQIHTTVDRMHLIYMSNLVRHNHDHGFESAISGILIKKISFKTCGLNVVSTMICRAKGDDEWATPAPSKVSGGYKG